MALAILKPWTVGAEHDVAASAEFDPVVLVGVTDESGRLALAQPPMPAIAVLMNGENGWERMGASRCWCGQEEQGRNAGVRAGVLDHPVGISFAFVLVKYLHG
ncbi:MAG: hypothetical protein ACR2JY_07080 [Chloroflexota bacterium]